MNDLVAPSQPLSAAEAARIAPRAEFRVFGQGIIEALRPRMYNGRTVLLQARRMPAETYFLSTQSDDANVKLRDGLLDVKLRVGVTPEGYEIFQPRGKYRFPMGRDELAMVLVQLRAELPLDEDLVTSERFVALARAHPALRVVSVEKMRHGFSIDGVTCEYAQVWFNGASTETACVESEDHAAMRRVIEELGLAALPNTSYLRAAQRVVGLV